MFVRFLGTDEVLSSGLRWLDAYDEAPVPIDGVRDGHYFARDPSGRSCYIPVRWCEIVDSDEPLFATLIDPVGFVRRSRGYGISDDGARELAMCPRPLLLIGPCGADDRIVYAPEGRRHWVVPVNEVAVW
jgi:hypothetical protein